MNTHSPALARAIEAIKEGGRAKAILLRAARKDKLRDRIRLHGLVEQAGLHWLGECSRKPFNLFFASLDEAILRLTMMHRAERALVLLGDWKRREWIAAGQWDRLVVARYLRRQARKLERRNAA